MAPVSLIPIVRRTAAAAAATRFVRRRLARQRLRWRRRLAGDAADRRIFLDCMQRRQNGSSQQLIHTHLAKAAVKLVITSNSGRATKMLDHRCYRAKPKPHASVDV
eukprot:TRINITY_DN331_c1_g1_i1.p3 TRINITY_DN331_c1_g1~~TRINITY_DN331_c1_g1_i1.p3  ORF type:complete len:106 (-),score=10.96 TRINITY_DN331_c1_g1_i1:919-1236(-)